jgi:hypothetical protein
MILVERTPPPVDLAAAAAEELDAFAAFHAQGGDEPSFKAYKLASVRSALEQLFHGKCAYCESAIGHISSIDVEHWRPKGKIRTGNGLVDGYWWLAGVWENLFPACPHCNRPTRHEAADGSTTAGKGMRFPIAGGHAAAPERGAEDREEPLLLDPCTSDPGRRPQLHLRFADEDEEVFGVVRAAGEAGSESELGSASIDVYALNRKDLVDRRRERLQAIRLAIATIRDLLAAREGLSPPASDAIEGVVVGQMKALRSFLDDSAEYLLMARQFAAPFLRELGIEEP